MKTLNIVFDDVNQQEFIDFGEHIQIVSSLLLYHSKTILKPFNLTFQQYNVLRILENSYPKSVSVNFISSSMLDRNSNGSRLVDKLVKKKWAEKDVSDLDKRAVNVKITDKGKIHLKAASEVVIKAYMDRISAVLTSDDARTANSVLVKISRLENV